MPPGHRTRRRPEEPGVRGWFQPPTGPPAADAGDAQTESRRRAVTGPKPVTDTSRVTGRPQTVRDETGDAGDEARDDRRRVRIRRRAAETAARSRRSGGDRRVPPAAGDRDAGRRGSASRRRRSRHPSLSAPNGPAITILPTAIQAPLARSAGPQEPGGEPPTAVREPAAGRYREVPAGRPPGRHHPPAAHPRRHHGRHRRVAWRLESASDRDRQRRSGDWCRGWFRVRGSGRSPC